MYFMVWTSQKVQKLWQAQFELQNYGGATGTLI